MENKKSYAFEAIRIALVLLIICSVIAGVVSLVYSVTLEPYNANVEAEVRKSVFAIFGADENSGVSYSEVKTESSDVTAVYEVKNGKEVLGYCVNIAASGFAGDINLMIGYNGDKTIRGITAISNAETTGFSKEKSRTAFLDSYIGKSGEISLSDVDAIGGATISSTAVNAAVNQANAVLAAIH